MKRTLRLLLTVGLSLVCVSLFAQKFPNYPIPQQPDTLRILGIGNSFTDDGMMYLPELLEAAGIRNVVLGRLYIPGVRSNAIAGNMPATPLRISITSRRPTAGRPFRRKRPCWTESPTNGGTSWYCNRRRANRASIRPISPGSAGWSRSCDGVAPMPEPASPGNRHGPMPAIRSTGISDDTRRTSN